MFFAVDKKLLITREIAIFLEEEEVVYASISCFYTLFRYFIMLDFQICSCWWILILFEREGGGGGVISPNQKFLISNDRNYFSFFVYLFISPRNSSLDRNNEISQKYWNLKEIDRNYVNIFFLFASSVSNFFLMEKKLFWYFRGYIVVPTLNVNFNWSRKNRINFFKRTFVEQQDRRDKNCGKFLEMLKKIKFRIRRKAKE